MRLHDKNYFYAKKFFLIHEFTKKLEAVLNMTKNATADGMELNKLLFRQAWC